MNKKLCTSCNKELEVSNFRTNKTKKDGLQSQCIDCRKAYNIAHYKQNKKTYLNKAKVNNARYILRYEELKLKMVCSNCPENHIACLHFHHLDPKTKKIGVAQLRTCSVEKNSRRNV